MAMYNWRFNSMQTLKGWNMFEKVWRMWWQTEHNNTTHSKLLYVQVIVDSEMSVH